MFPTVGEDRQHSFIMWAEVYSGVATEEFQPGVHVAPWSFHTYEAGARPFAFLEDTGGPSDQSFQVAFQPLQPTDFLPGEFDRNAAAASLTAPLTLGGDSCQLAMALAMTRAKTGRNTLRPILATGRYLEDKVWSVEGAQQKQEAVTDFWTLKGIAHYFVYPIHQGKDPFARFDPRCRTVSRLDTELDNELLTDGFDGYRHYLCGTGADGEAGSAESVTSALQSHRHCIVPVFDEDPSGTARSVFRELTWAWLRNLRQDSRVEDRSNASARLADEPVIVLCPLDELPQEAASLAAALAGIVDRQMNGHDDPPGASRFKDKLAGGQVILVVQPKRSRDFTMDDATRRRLHTLLELEGKTRNRVVLVCPDAHLRWWYCDRLLSSA
jgi:hypothetical protein